MRAAEQRRAEAERDGEALHSTSCDSITQVRTRPGMRTDSARALNSVRHEDKIDALWCTCAGLPLATGCDCFAHCGNLPALNAGSAQPRGL